MTHVESLRLQLAGYLHQDFHDDYADACEVEAFALKDRKNKINYRRAAWPRCIGAQAAQLIKWAGRQEHGEHGDLTSALTSFPEQGELS